MKTGILILVCWLAGSTASRAQPAETVLSSRTLVTTTTSPAGYKDRDAILALLTRRMQLVNEGRAGALNEVFTANAVIQLKNQPGQTFIPILDAYGPVVTQLKLSNHTVRNLKIENQNATVTESFTYRYSPAGGQVETGTGTISSTLLKGADRRWRVTQSKATYGRP